MLHVYHSCHAQSPGSSLPVTRAAPLLARFLLTVQGAEASGLFSQPRGRHGDEMAVAKLLSLDIQTILPKVFPLKASNSSESASSFFYTGGLVAVCPSKMAATMFGSSVTSHIFHKLEFVILFNHTNF